MYKIPIAIKEALRNINSPLLPQSITPELLILGIEVSSLDLFPNLYSVTVDEKIHNRYDPVGNIQLVDRKTETYKEKCFYNY